MSGASVAPKRRDPKAVGAPKARVARRGQAGVTLLELLIGIFVAAILAVFIYRVLIDQNKAYRRQDEMVRLQQSVRFAMEFMSRSVEMAGYGTYGWTIGNAQYPAIEVVDGGSGAPDQLQVLYADPSRLAITTWGNPLGCNTTIISFENENAAFQYKDASQMLCYSYINSTKMRSYLFDVTSYNITDNEVEVVTPVGTTAYDTECTGNLPPDMLCAPANWYIFYVDNVVDGGGGPGTPDKPLLMIREATAPLDGVAVTPSASDSVLAEGIEHLNVQFCMSDAGSCASTATWADTFVANTDADHVRQVRLTLWAKSDRISDAATLYANPLTGATDHKFRLSSTTSLLLRNLKRLEEYN